MAVICEKCLRYGEPTKVHNPLGWAMWVLFFAPLPVAYWGTVPSWAGLLFAVVIAVIGSTAGRSRACHWCKSTAVVDDESPRGRLLLRQREEAERRRAR